MGVKPDLRCDASFDDIFAALMVKESHPDAGAKHGFFVTSLMLFYSVIIVIFCNYSG
ncbi:MAG: hypothetical protein WC364_08625 [Eubacteriales bacterium]|jgi:hypothetical protein